MNLHQYGITLFALSAFAEAVLCVVGVLTTLQCWHKNGQRWIRWIAFSMIVRPLSINLLCSYSSVR